MNLNEKIEKAKEEILAASESSFYIVAYSGGKDSSVALDLTLSTLKENSLKNPVYILISRTESEYPEFERYLEKTLSDLKEYLKRSGMENVKIIEGSPEDEKRFLYLIIGKGYPVPRNNMSWCNLKKKLEVMEKIEENLKKKHKDLIPVKIIGTRKEEGATRAKKIDKYHSKVKDGILSLMPLRDFTTGDIWIYIDRFFSFNKDELLKLYDNVEINDSNSTRQGCWFCPLIKTDPFLRNNYPSIEKYRKFLREYMLAPGTRYEISRDFTKKVAGPYKMEIREKFFKELVREVSKTKNPFDFISEKEINDIQKEHVKEGWLTLNIFKEYLKLHNNKNIKSFITSTDSINVLFPRFRAVRESEWFKDVKVSEFCTGVARRILLKEDVLYGYKLKTIETPVDNLDISEELKKEYAKLQEKETRTRIPLKRDLLRLSLKIMHNYLYYLHKFHPEK